MQVHQTFCREHQFREDNVPRNKDVTRLNVTNPPSFLAMRMDQKDALFTSFTKFIFGAINLLCKSETPTRVQKLVLRGMTELHLIRILTTMKQRWRAIYQITGCQHTFTPETNRQMGLKSQRASHIHNMYVLTFHTIVLLRGRNTFFGVDHYQMH